MCSAGKLSPGGKYRSKNLRHHNTKGSVSTFLYQACWISVQSLPIISDG